MAPPNFPPNGFQAIVATYGNPLDYVDAPIAWENLILTNISGPPGLLLFAGQPVRSLRCHKLAADAFRRALQGMVDRGLSGVEYGGTYIFRVKRTNPTHVSTHAIGISIDLNQTRCPLGSDPALQDQRIVSAFDEAGFTWGGRFAGVRDSQHFQLASGY